jgi:hypothetical protein
MMMNLHEFSSNLNKNIIVLLLSFEFYDYFFLPTY